MNQRSKIEGKTKTFRDKNIDYIVRDIAELNATPAPSPTGLPDKIYSAQITNLGLGTTPQVDAVFVNTYDGVIGPTPNLPFPSNDGRIGMTSADLEWTLGRTSVSVSVVGSGNNLSPVQGISVVGGSIDEQYVTLFMEDSTGTRINGKTIMIEIKTYL